MREEFLLLWVLSSASDLDGEVVGWGGGQVRSGGKCAGKGAAGGGGGGRSTKGVVSRNPLLTIKEQNLQATGLSPHK